MPVPATTDLLEREADLALLDGALDRARGGTGTVVLVAGEAGIGKSSLVTAWRGRLGGTDTRVLTGWCDDFLTGRILGPLRDVAREAGGALAAAVARADTGAVLEAVLGLLGDPLRPVVLVLEDVHWADEATLDVVRYVGRRVAELPAVLVLTFRDGEVDAEHPLTGVLGALAAAPIVRVAPRPLSEEAIATLLAGSDRDAQQVAAITGGNPFFVTEVAQTHGVQVPATVTDTVLARVRALSDAPRRALQVLAVMPGAVDRDLADAIVGDVTLLAAAERRGLLTSTVGEVRFRHELARRAVEGGLTTIERVAAHRRVLEVLLARDHPDALPVLHHAVAAGAHDVVAARGPAAVTEAFRAGAHRQAVVLGQQVLAHADRLAADEHARLLEQHAWALYNLHAFLDAIDASHRAAQVRADLDDPAAHARALLTWSRMLYIANDPGPARAAMDQAVAVADHVADDPALAAEVLVNRAQLLVLTDALDEAAAVVDPALAAAEAVGRDDLVVLAHNYRGMLRTNQGDLGGLDELYEAVTRGRAAGTLEPTARTYTNLVEELLRAGRWAHAETAIEEAIAYYDDHDFVSHRYNTVSQRGLLLLWRGDWDRAEEVFRDLHASVPEAGVLEALALTGLARLAVWRGAPDAAALVDRAWQVALASGAAQYVTTVGTVRLEYAWLHERPELIADTVARALLPHAPVRHRGLLVRELQLAGHDAGVVVDADAYPEPYRSGLRGDWRAAAAHWEALDAVFPRALELAGSGQVEAMLDALRVFEQLGADSATRWLRRRLRAAGLRAIPRGPQPSTRENPAGLTDRQVQVLRLVADGLTNAEIADRLVLSTRTVDHHVSAILQKLGVGTRHEAATTAEARAIG